MRIFYSAVLGTEECPPYLFPVNGLCIAGCAGHASVHAIAALVLGVPARARGVNTACTCAYEPACLQGRRALLAMLALVAFAAVALRAPPSRRELLSAAAAIGTLTTRGLPAIAASDQRPVLVLGAGGGTGRECVNYLLAQKRPCIAATRTGELADAPTSSLLRVVQGDVTSVASMSALITPGSLSGVIYAASASRQADAKKASNAKAVDEIGVIECAKLCISSEVPRLVLVSSGGVSKPASAVYIFLNVAAGGIMDAKISGENQLRRLYAASDVAEKGLGYTVVRPGGLVNDAPLGVSAVELNQGDEKSGRISRADVAAICIESLGSAAAFDTTFECYYGDTAKELNGVMASNAKAISSGVPTDPTNARSGKERRADAWPKLFEGLERDLA